MYCSIYRNIIITIIIIIIFKYDYYILTVDI